MRSELIYLFLSISSYHFIIFIIFIISGRPGCIYLFIYLFLVDSPSYHFIIGRKTAGIKPSPWGRFSKGGGNGLESKLQQQQRNNKQNRILDILMHMGCCVDLRILVGMGGGVELRSIGFLCIWVVV